ncbi:MAG: uroporphyrinogen decarboxylase family protein [Victivallales bacterium]
MTNKQRMEIILQGGVPDVPPHWELVFQIEKEFFGIDPASVHNATYSSQDEKNRAIWNYNAEVYSRLVDELGWGAVPGGYGTEDINIMKKKIGDRALVAGYEGGGVFWMPTGENIMDFVVRLFEQPGQLHAEARIKCAKAKEALSRMADAGADFFVGTYDFGFNDAPFISPEHFSEFVTPYLAEIVQHVHGMGKKILLHSDGCIDKVLGQIHSTGIDGYQSVDPQGHMDIRKVREQYPDWILMGNVACNMLQDADDGKIRESVRYCMAHGGVGRRYIFSTSNCIFAGMPPGSYKIMLDEYRKIIGNNLN